jgi:hypothetical protein
MWLVSSGDSLSMGVGELGGTSWGCRLSCVCGLGNKRKEELWMDVVGT